MSDREIIAIFYSINELDLKDIDKEIYTKEKKEIFHLFFFNNKNLHFDKSIISKEVLNKKFEKIPSIINFDDKNNRLIMTKSIDNFNTYEFNNETDKEYGQYLKNIGYRIESIIQTFKLFIKLYNNKSLIFIFPQEIFDTFCSFINQNGIKYTQIDKKNKDIEKFDIFYWINYFSRKDLESPYKGEIQIDNIKNIIEIFL